MNNSNALTSLILLPEVLNFMALHENDDTVTIPLKYTTKVDFDLGAITQQIELRQKAKKKIKTFITASILLLPKLYEQSTHEEVAQYKATFISGHSMLDATAGLGIDTFFIGKNFKQIICLESNSSHLEILRHNYHQHHFKAKLLNISLEEFLKTTTEHYDVIYVDPDRRPDANRKFIDIDQCTPNVIELKKDLLDRAKEVWIKLSPMIDINTIMSNFSPHVSVLHCISHHNEMKEILVCLKSGEQKTTYAASNIAAANTTYFTSDYNNTKPLLSAPLSYLFEPNVALIKSKLCMEYSIQNNLRVIYPNGYFFTTDHPEEQLQGRLFQIIRVLPFKKGLLAQFIKQNEIKKANISCRNFFWKPEEVKKQLKLSDGGEWYLFCYNDASKKPITVWAKKLSIIK